MAVKLNYEAMFTRRKDGRWQKVANGKCLTDRDPERLWQRIQALEAPPEVTFRQIAERWENEHRKTVTDRTWANYKPHYDDILARHGDKPVASIGALDVIHDLQRAKSKGSSATIVSTRRSLYSMILDFAVVEGAIPYNPASGIKLPRGLKRGRRSAPGDEIIDVILRNLDAPFGLFPFLLLCTGLRKSEALALEWRDIDFGNRIIRITKSVDYTVGARPKLKAPKTESGVRDAPMIGVLHEVLIARRPGNGDGLLFPSPDSNRGGAGGGLMSERAYEGAWVKYCRSAGLLGEDGKPVITAHHLRHATATLLFESGADILTAQRILGHANPETTQAIYTELRQKQQQKSVSKLDKAMAKKMAKLVK